MSDADPDPDPSSTDPQEQDPPHPHAVFIPPPREDDESNNGETAASSSGRTGGLSSLPKPPGTLGGAESSGAGAQSAALPQPVEEEEGGDPDGRDPARRMDSVASLNAYASVNHGDVTEGESRHLGKPIMMVGRGSLLQAPKPKKEEEEESPESSKKAKKQKTFGNRADSAMLAKLASETERLQAKRDHAYKSMSPLRKKMVRFVGHRTFQMGISSVIVANAIYMGIETDIRLDPEQNAEDWYIPEFIFTTIFSIELLLRIYTERGLFFLDSWNDFDFVLVSVAFIDTYIIYYLDSAEMPGGKALLALRVLRLARLARIVRLLRFFKELWLLVVGVVDAMRTLVWAWILIGLVVYVFAILAVRTLGQPYKEDEQMQKYFGNVFKGMFCLFTVMTTEGWAEVARSSMAYEPWSAFFFIVFLGMTTFAVMNVVVAVIVENTLATAGQQKNDLQEKAQNEQKTAATKILEIFYQADQDSNGNLTKEEFLEALERPDVVKYLHEVGIDVRQAENLFDILDFDDSGELDASEFLQGVLKARGTAGAKDILAVQCDLWRAERQMLNEADRLKRSAVHELKEVRSSMRRLSQRVGELAVQLAVPAG